MSSEMREFVKEMRAGTPCYVAKVGGGRCVNGAECLRCAERLDWADRLERTFLARTEAGADGADVMWRCHIAEHPEVVEWSPHAPTAAGWVGRPYYTHLQDASGDKRPAIFDEASDRVAFVDAHTWPENGFKNVWITHAMQAKEAK